MRIELSEYETNLYNFTLCGELLVFGLSIIESRNQIKLEEDLVKKALVYMLKRHPLLRAHLEVDDKKVFLKITEDKIKYEICQDDLKWFKLSSRNELEPSLEKFNSHKIDYEKKCKLWRSEIYDFEETGIQKYAIAFLLPLFLTDALNITSISIEIVNIINSLISDTVCDEMIQNLEVLDNMYKIIDRTNPLTEKQFKKIEEINNTKTSSFRLASLFKSETETGSKIEMFYLSVEQSQKLVNLAKQKSIKFTGFLMTCIFYSIRELYKENNLPDPINIKFGISTNLRFRLKPNLDFSSIGYFSTLISINTVYPKFGKYENIWQDSKYLDELIAENSSMESGAIFSNSHDFNGTAYLKNLFETVPDKKKVCSVLNSECTWDVIASNIGTYLCNKKKQKPSEPFKINEIYFSDSQNSVPPIDAGLLYHVSNWNDQLMFMITSNRSAISSKYSYRLIEILKNILNSF